jgi:ribosomal-protein-alanine N-acetyltransferase
MKGARVELRDGLPWDLDAIVALERATEHAPHWPEATYAAMLGFRAADPDQKASAVPRRRLIVAEADDALVGFAVGLVHAAVSDWSSVDRTSELESVVVAADRRRAGIGRALCLAVLEWCRTRGAVEVVLEVRAASAAAIALYEGLGFEPLGRRPRYYRDPEDDALMMRLRFD